MFFFTYVYIKYCMLVTSVCIHIRIIYIYIYILPIQIIIYRFRIFRCEVYVFFANLTIWGVRCFGDGYNIVITMVLNPHKLGYNPYDYDYIYIYVCWTNHYLSTCNWNCTFFPCNYSSFLCDFGVCFFIVLMFFPLSQTTLLIFTQSIYVEQHAYSKAPR